jgi:cyclic pyranopterin phosphate synthase
VSELTHLNAQGESHMVNVGDKPETDRAAIATGIVVMKAQTAEKIKENGITKGNVLEIARVAGITATKRTADLIPLCHPLRITSVDIDLTFKSETELRILAKVTATDRTGVEMEALTAVATAGLVVYDMCKSIDRAMTITDVCLVEKSGGKSGHFKRQYA